MTEDFIYLSLLEECVAFESCILFLNLTFYQKIMLIETLFILGRKAL